MFALNRFSTLLPLTTALTLGVAAFVAAPSQAQACGGTFCDTGPNVMPVDQTGENILFVQDGAFIEAHIQIQYDGDPERFAWLIPVTVEPQVTVGSQTLFDNLLSSTVPNFGLSTSFDCNEPDRGGPGFGCGMAMAEDAGSNAVTTGGFFGDTGDEGGDGGPEILQRGVAGAFEYVVLTGTTVDSVVTWLDDNGYQQDEDAPPILQEYLEKDFIFVAVKLQSGAGIDEIQPLVLRYEGMEPCVPTNLTAIAAKDDMGIRVFFAGEERAVPTNFALVEPNWAALDWNTPGEGYEELVTLAIDEAEDGHGWVTEYASTMSVVSTFGLLGPTWSSYPFQEAPINGVVDILESQGLMSCNSFDGCQYFHPLVEPLLNQFIPVPEGVSPDAFYDCLECHDALLDVDNWNPQDFADAFAERIVEPGKRAEEIIENYPYLTRMYTTMSPHEMTVDPTFHTNGDLGDYVAPATAVNHVECESPDWTETPSGRKVHHDDSNAYPGEIPNMPMAAAIYSVPSMGAPQTVVDNADAIDDAIKAWNKAHPLHGEGGNCAVDRTARNQGLISFAALLALMGIRRRRRE